MAKIPTRKLEEARNSLVKMLYGGNESGLLSRARSIVDRALVTGAVDGRTLGALANFGVSNPQFVGNEIGKVISNELAYAKDPKGFLTKIYKDTVNPDIDAANLTDDELKDKYETLKEIQNAKPDLKIPKEFLAGSLIEGGTVDFGSVSGGGNLDRAKLIESLKRTLSSSSLDKGTIEGLANKAADQIVGQRGNYNPSTGNAAADKALREASGYYQGEISKGTFDAPFDLGAEGVNLSADLTNYGNLVGGREKVASDRAYMEQVLKQAPETLAAERAKFFSGERGRAKDYLMNYFLPSTVEDLNTRGLAGRSGDLGDLIAQKVGNLESTISSAQMTQEEQDALLLADMAYQAKLQDLTEATANYRSTQDNIFTNTRNKQNQSFADAQGSLNREFETNLFKQQNEAALKEYQKRIQTQSDAAKKQNQANFYSDLAGTATSIGASYLVGKQLNKGAPGVTSTPASAAPAKVG